MSEYINIGEYISESIEEIIIDENYNLRCSFSNEKKELYFPSCVELFYQLITTTHTQFYGFGTEVGFLPDEYSSNGTIERFEPIFQLYEVALNKNPLLIVYFPLLQNLYEALEQENVEKINELIVDLKRVISVANEQLYIYRGYVYECLVIDFTNHLHTYKLVELYNQKNPNNCYLEANANLYKGNEGIKRNLDITRSIMNDFLLEKTFLMYVEYYITKDLIIKLCENCSKTFVAKYSEKSNYCTNLYTKVQTCRHYAATRSYRLKEQGKLSIQREYNKLYNKVNDQIKKKKISENAMVELKQLYPTFKSFFEMSPTLKVINDFSSTIDEVIKRNKL